MRAFCFNTKGYKGNGHDIRQHTKTNYNTRFSTQFLQDFYICRTMIAFELRQGNANKDGTRTVRVYIYHNGKAYYTTKYRALEKDWDYKRGCFKELTPNDKLRNNALKSLYSEIDALCLRNPNLEASDIVKLIGGGGTITLISFFEKFIEECQAGKYKRSVGTIKRYKVVIEFLKTYGRTDFDTINQRWYTNFVGDLRKAGKNENTIANYIKAIKMILRHAFEMGVSTNTEYQKKYFKKTSEPTDSIYLTVDEIKLWEKVDLKLYPSLIEERDRFLISYYFLLRFGDSLRVNESNLSKEGNQWYLKLETEKKRSTVIIPVSKKAHDILKKYDFKMPETTNQESNEKLKKIGFLAGINKPVTLLKETKPKCEFIQTHTARRSGATNLYLEGMDIKDISHLLGHARIQQTEEYLKISRLDSARKAAKFKFFK